MLRVSGHQTQDQLISAGVCVCVYIKLKAKALGAVSDLISDWLRVKGQSAQQPIINSCSNQ